MSRWRRLFDSARPAVAQHRTFERARCLALPGLACLGRRTISGVLCAAGQQYPDWSAGCRFLEKERVDSELLWAGLRHQGFGQLASHASVAGLMDDTLCHTRGAHIHRSSWRRDPLGPAFAGNLIWASRFLQLSVALPQQPDQLSSLARAIPTDIQYGPSPRKPSPKAPPDAWELWRNAPAAATVSALGGRRIAAFRAGLGSHPGGPVRSLRVCVDGALPCRAVFRNLASRTTLVGRIRKDAWFYAPPTASRLNPGRGRQRCHGDPLPTPERYRQDDSIPWQTVRACAAGNAYDFDVKTIAPLRRKAAGANPGLLLLIIRPVAYRLKQGAGLNYRKPACLICTGPSLSPAQILQACLWRREIEVNFRDEKTPPALDSPRYAPRLPRAQPPRSASSPVRCSCSPSPDPASPASPCSRLPCSAANQNGPFKGSPPRKQSRRSALSPGQVPQASPTRTASRSSDPLPGNHQQFSSP